MMMVARRSPVIVSVALLVVILSSCFAYGAPPAYTLDDAPIAGGVVQSLSGPASWSVSSPSLPNLKEVAGNVPGDLLTDLFEAKVIPDPIYENNILNSTLWDNRVWIYQRDIVLSQQDIQDISSSNSSSSDILLVFDGIKMGASIALNNAPVGTSLSQFERLVFSLRVFSKSVSPSPLKVGANTLTVTFDPNMVTGGLFAQCTGGWDWAPYSETKTRDGYTSFGLGLWKTVYLTRLSWLALTDLVVQTHYTGTFPTSPLQQGDHAPFKINVTLHLKAATATSARLQVRPSWVPSEQQPALSANIPSIPAGESTFSVQFFANASQISLWWPAGLGKQTLYDLDVLLSPPASVMMTMNNNKGEGEGKGEVVAAPVTDSRRIAFRLYALVTGNDTDPSYVARSQNATGSDSLGMRVRVNGQPIYIRGANVIPMDTMEGRFSADAHRRMALSARDAMMNMVRIWGGGIYLPQIFYDTCDEIGLMVMHDLMNRGSWTGAPREESAYRYQLRRLSYHPSIVQWNGCNECNGTAGSIVPNAMNVLVSEDTSRVMWPSCPGNGWSSGANKLSSLPDGQPIVQSRGPFQEHHGPYQHGSGWPSKNGDPANLELFGSQLPINIYPSDPIGLGRPNFFISEFGSSVWSSFESLSPTVDPSHWSLHGGSGMDTCSGYGFPNECIGSNVMARRNYPCDSMVMVYFGGLQYQFDGVGEEAFRRQLYLCQIAGALIVKIDIEQFRSQNAFGTMIWQLNEIWPTGGWGTIEYGTPSLSGQVVGGRWKPIHYWLRESLFTDVIIACGQDWCYVKNDLYQAFPKVNIQVFNVNMTTSALESIYLEQGVPLGAGPGMIHWFQMKNPENLITALVTDASNNNGNILAQNTILRTEPRNLGLKPVAITATVASQPNPDQSITVMLTKNAQEPALYVTLSTLAEGSFSRNAFLMVDNKMSLTFIPFTSLDAFLLRTSLRVTHLGMYV